MFGFFKKGALRQMHAYCRAIQMAIYCKLKNDFVAVHGNENAGQFAAAVTNRLFAQPPTPEHEKFGSDLIEGEAVKFLMCERATDLYLALVLCLRTWSALAHDGHDDAQVARLREQLVWIHDICPLPPDEPTGVNMRQLSESLTRRYAPSVGK